MNIARRLVVLLSLLAASVAWSAPHWARYRILVPDEIAAQRLADSSLQLFSDNITLGATDVIVGPKDEDVLKALDLPSVKVQDLPAPDSFYRGETEGGPPDYHTTYLTYTEILQQYEIWRAQYPLFVTRRQIGTTVQGRAIWVYKLRVPGARSKRTVFLQAGIHAREWISPAVVMYLFDSVKNKAMFPGADSDIFSKFDLAVVPSVNPDGYDYTWATDRYWRKNRRNNGGGVYGVDLNRNYSKGWGGSGSSSMPSSDTYRGPSAFSEPETTAIRNYLATASPIAGFIDYHSYGQLVLHPWGYTTTPCADNALFQSIGNDYKQAVFNVFGVNYTAGPTSTTLYVASGASNDWAYDLYHIPAYAVELRDTGTNGFVLPSSQILPTQQENWAGFRAWLKRLLP